MSQIHPRINPGSRRQHCNPKLSQNVTDEKLASIYVCRLVILTDMF